MAAWVYCYGGYNPVQLLPRSIFSMESCAMQQQRNFLETLSISLFHSVSALAIACTYCNAGWLYIATLQEFRSSLKVSCGNLASVDKRSYMSKTHPVMATLTDNRYRFSGGNPVAVHDGVSFSWLTFRFHGSWLAEWRERYAHGVPEHICYNRLFLVNMKHSL